MKPTIRKYCKRDKDACIRLFDANTPPYFAPNEACSFARFLDSPSGSYFVAEVEHVVVGCGGWELLYVPSSAALNWGMIDPALHGRRLGTALLEYRLTALAELGVRTVRISTSRLVSEFFKKAGFFETQVITNGHGMGLDDVKMELSLGDWNFERVRKLELSQTGLGASGLFNGKG